MSVPVVGTVLMSMLLYGDFGASRAHFRQARVPTPSSQALTLALPGNGDSCSDLDSDDEE